MNDKPKVKPRAAVRANAKNREGWGANDPSFTTPDTIYTYGKPLGRVLRTNTYLGS